MTKGRATEASMLDNTQAPSTPPMMPGMRSRANNFQFTFLCSAWLMPEAAVVKVSTAWTLAEATAGGRPITLTSNVELIRPNAMPSAPSTSCAAKPIAMNGRIASIEASETSAISGMNSPRSSSLHDRHG